MAYIDSKASVSGLGGGVPEEHSAPRPSRGREFTTENIVPQELARAKKAFSTRRVERSFIETIIRGYVRPRTGDLLLAQVDRLGYQRRIELENGRKASLHVGDKIIVAYGDRYATDQFESEVPLDLGPTNLVATGGVASKALSRTSGMRAATDINPLGLLGDARGKILNTRGFSVGAHPIPKQRPKVIAVLGTSMNSGKTTTNQALVQGLSRAGFRPGALKITGTGSGGDYWSVVDAGAHLAADFTDAGYASTYKLPISILEEILVDLIGFACASDCDIILVEIADGIFQEQNEVFIQSNVFRGLVDGILFAAGEALGAAHGVSRLTDMKLPLLGVSGKLTASELLIREARHTFGTPVYKKDELADPEKVCEILSLRKDCPLVSCAECAELPVKSGTNSFMLHSVQIPRAKRFEGLTLEGRDL